MKAETLADLLNTFPDAYVMSEESDVAVVFTADENGNVVFDIRKKERPLE